MKNNKLLLCSALLTGTILTAGFVYLNDRNSFTIGLNQKQESNESEAAAAGAAEWLFNVQKNPITGQIDPMDVIRIREEAYQMRNNRSTAASLGLNWSELGPDNVGGRTRAILIDNRDASHQTMFAGSVSGGLWTSTNGGSTWSNVPGFDQQPNLAIVSLTQAPNGDIYAGTGEGNFYFYSGTGSAGILGAGIYKLLHDSTTFSRIPSTIPTSTFNTSASAATAFCSVHEMATDPVNSNRIYAATMYGLRSSNNGGLTWLHPVRTTNGTAVTTVALDVDVASDGTVIANINNKLYRSATGDSGTFTPVTTGLPASGVGRIEFAIAPSDPNYMYALAGKTGNGLLLGVYQSIDKGLTWSTIGNGGSSQFELFGTGQADYDCAIGVFPDNKYKIIIGGVGIWKWEQTNPSVPGIGQWSLAATQGGSPFNPYYVHSDVHEFRFHPSNPSVFFVGCDGGIFRGFDNGSEILYQPMNHGYNVTQFYSIAFEGDDPSRRAFTSGAQDNGTNYISGHGNTVESAEAIDGGDGAECETSYLNPNVSFSTVYYGTLRRHSSKGGGGSSFYPDKFTTLFPTLGNAGFASFVTPIALYETKTATNSPDFYRFINTPSSQTIGMGDGIKKHFTGTLNLPYPSATIVPDSISIKSGLQTVRDDQMGALKEGTTTVGTINYITGAFDFTFLTAPANAATVNLTFSVIYASGSNLDITRADYEAPLNYTTTTQIDPGDTAMIYDPFQAKIAVGFSGGNGVWMTKGALNFSITPKWFKLGTLSGEAEELAWSNDGDILYVGTSAGVLYRFSNLAPVTDSANGDVSSPHSVVVKTQIASFGGFITGLSVNPTDANKVAVSIGGYSSSITHVYYSTTAATCASSSSTANFAGKQGTGTTKLPGFPVYSVLIEQNDTKRLIIGTELGVYSTADITATNPVWTVDNGTTGFMPNVPVFKIRQQRRGGNEVYNPAVIYAATHGRGAWKCETFLGWVGITNPGGNSTSKSKSNSGIVIYPNPMVDQGTIAFNLDAPADVVISIYNLQGQLIKVINSGKLNSGEQKIPVSTNEHSKGTYLVSIDGSAIHATAKFVVVK